MSATYALAALVETAGGPIPNFDEIATRLLPRYPGASELLLSVGGTIRYVAPIRGNEKALGLDLLSSPAQKTEASLSRDSGKLTLAGPLDLVQGGEALAGRLPVFLPDADGQPAFWGFSEVVMRLPEALAPAELSQLVTHGYQYQLSRINPQTRRKQMIDASTRRDLADPVEQAVQVPNGQWTLSVVPGNGWADPLGLSIKVAIGLLFAVLSAYLAKLLTDLKSWGSELESLVLRRTTDIAAAKDHLKATLDATRRAERVARLSRTRLRVTLDATQIAIWDWDLKRDRWYASRVYYTSLGYAHERHGDREVWIERVHPEDRAKVSGAIASALTGIPQFYEYEARLRHADGSYRWMRVRGKAVERDSQGVATRVLGIRMDITEQKKTEERVQRLAHFDTLTGLPNRALLNERMAYILPLAAHNDQPIAVLALDIDKFKNINDTFGHHIGDELLIEVAKRLQSLAREEDTVARIGGDEFVVVSIGTDMTQATQLARRTLELLSTPIQTKHLELVVTPSIGAAMFPVDGRDFDALLKCADTAMHRAKHAGRNHYVFFTPEMSVGSARNLLLENALRHAIERGELQLRYQPQISLTDGRITGAEALLRWRHPDLGDVSPAEFIPITEDSGQILQIGAWVLRSAAGQLRAWLDGGLPPINLAVNVSSTQFRHPNLPGLIGKILEEVGLPPRYLELELTEGVAMGDPQGAIAVINDLHQLGIRIAIDDFGTGYSSLNYLKRFRAYKLKIDQSFTAGVTRGPEDRAIVNSIISLADGLGLHTIAEGVETAEQLAFLRAQGCREAQGFYFSRPLPADEFSDLARDTARQSSWLS
jgi:diguanylate cyclase (GGDEF)-like protein/PAS domain S-box-containing protein